jgi:hypothetical protein
MKAPFFAVQSATISSYCSSQPVVPEMTGTLTRKQLILTLLLGTLKSIATSAVDSPS